jgi:hypothetical protein
MEFRKGRILLAGLLLLMLVVLIAVGPFVSLAEPLDTYHQGWSLVRETANEDGANFAAVYDLTGGAGTSNFAGKDSSSVLNGGPFHIRPTGFPVPVSPGSRWQFVICGEARNGADDTFSFDVVGWAAGNGMLQKIVEGDGVLGTQTVVTYPDDGADAVGATVGVTGVTFDLAGGSLAKLFTDTSDTGSFDGAVVGMMAYVTGTNITDGIYDVNGVTDANNITINVTASGDTTDATVDMAVTYWADDLTLDATTKWPKAQGDLAGINLYNDAANQIAVIEIQPAGLEWLQFVVYDADGATGEEAGNITVYGRRM